MKDITSESLFLKYRKVKFMTDSIKNLKPFINTLETKKSDVPRPPTPRPEPISGDSDKS